MMQILTNAVIETIKIIESWQLLLVIFTLSFLLKLFLVGYLVHKKIKNNNIPYPLYFLMLILFSSLICDIPWLLTPFNNSLNFRIYNAFLRLSWAFTIVLYQSLTLFIESLTKKKRSFSFTQKIFCIISGCLFLWYLGIAFIDINCSHFSQKYWFEKFLCSFVTIYLLFPLMLTSIFTIIKKLRANNTPRILTKQIKIFILGIILPFWFSDFLQIISLLLSPVYIWINTNYTFVNLNTILITYAIFYSIRKIMGIRFLNLNPSIKAPINIDFMNTFKITLERLSNTSNQHELCLLVQEFFKEEFNIPFNKVTLHIRSSPSSNRPVSYIENFLTSHSADMQKQFYTHKIMSYDEIAFDDFYDHQVSRGIIIEFLQSIRADIFLPIYEKENLIAYIIIEREARTTQFYSQTEHDMMLVFASYLSNTINMINNQQINTLIEQEKVLQEELYRKHQEINQYKESIRSFTRSSPHKQIGIIFYKNRLFSFGNQAAQEMINIHLNIQVGHPITRALKQIVDQVERYNTSHTVTVADTNGTKLVLSGVPNLENNNSCIITVSYPDIADILKPHLDKLHDPSERDYLLYLETTKIGILINQLIPSTGEQFLNFKIELLKTALSKKATLLTMPEEDLLEMVELLHHISLREQLHTITINAPCHNKDIAIKLFGINPLFTHASTHELPVLEQLNKTGTLFIKNIHYLDLETQKQLAEFIRYGHYHALKSEQKKTSAMRIICSIPSDEDLALLVKEGTFSLTLFNQLSKRSLTMPLLTSLPEHEWELLTEAFTQQALKSSCFKTLFALTPHDKKRLTVRRPTSLHELKKRVLLIIESKSQKYDTTETLFDPTYDANNPNLTAIARLGKQALRNKDAMALLWDTFKNQHKIATFLGVNRSSVHRRCKMYNFNN